MFALDTNICIYALNNHPITLRSKFIKYKNQISISSIVYAELFYGVANTDSPKLRNRREDELRKFIALIQIKMWDETAAEHYGNIRANLKKTGQIIGNMDMLIAAHARSSGKILVTNNEKEFSRIPELLIENWTK